MGQMATLMLPTLCQCMVSNTELQVNLIIQLRVECKCTQAVTAHVLSHRSKYLIQTYVKTCGISMQNLVVLVKFNSIDIPYYQALPNKTCDYFSHQDGLYSNLCTNLILPTLPAIILAYLAIVKITA